MRLIWNLFYYKFLRNFFVCFFVLLYSVWHYKDSFATFLLRGSGYDGGGRNAGGDGGGGGDWVILLCIKCAYLCHWIDCNVCFEFNRIFLSAKEAMKITKQRWEAADCRWECWFRLGLLSFFCPFSTLFFTAFQCICSRLLCPFCCALLSAEFTHWANLNRFKKRGEKRNDSTV